MKKISIVFILSIYSIFASGQVINEVLLDMGFNVNTYEIKSKSGFSNNSDAEEISVFINLLGRKKISEKISCDSGFGISREILGFNPLIKVSEVKGLENSGLDTLTIAKIGKIGIGNFNFHLVFHINCMIKLMYCHHLLLYPELELLQELQTELHLIE